MKSSAIDEVDDDVLEIRSDVRGDAMPGPPVGLFVFREPGTDFVHVAAWLESPGTYELRIRTLVPPGK